ncbi:hypothetical protein DTO013E5_860 [Penicillium roqueforti]|uniref:Protein kinase-like domain n=1 Tax=Penicillium roqueforti (strain FM164) TaxID=1365484 RepID=W6Q3J2_PENRF|nr:uncharacterized protein LCP9604111_2114 [Penicillium roqueforti]CDM28714.1 Protein kinase-like domain [Penicillium roqueforti FM164]KAF9252118.1 hypothetical protein LCP9604111_2114 [Penicillium roqueforti]KAI1837387.1 hypothetical protein CBS147337_1670 [Penicillium roqueforti]KAI2687825.1 hypothetical protein LCP963914a_3343 [Penicillium roqueforti]KAI2689802.1 hypothetical protein CBS147355_253 [Penicillium roqueforti]
MTKYVVYGLESAINAFFSSSTTTTRQQCDDFAIARAGGVSTPLQMQGVCSYTVTAGPDKSRIFQFRCEDSTIDIGNISLAKAVHPEFIASCKYLGTFGNLQPLHIYEMENLSGITHIIARIPPGDMSRQSNTIKDLARFFAQSWNNDRRPYSDDTAILLKEFQSNFDLLAQDLPSRFAPNLDMVRKELPLLFSGALPFVLSHQDLNMMNLLIDPETGNMTGIVDWAESRILPFGFALYGLDNILGLMGSTGWHYYDNHRKFENLFWKTFREEANDFSDADLRLTRVARMAGLFYHYGFLFDIKGTVESVRMDQADGSLAYLDAFCTSCYEGRQRG